MGTIPERQKEEAYCCLEQGPIRPPAEARSLLIRVSRNCPWNHCTFCPLYKRKPFSIRPLEHILRDIDTVHGFIGDIQKCSRSSQPEAALNNVARQLPSDMMPVFQAAYQWAANGMESIFLQDANALIVKTSDLVAILTHLKKRFPMVKRITSFARSQTILRKKSTSLHALAEAGLNRVHVGLESGSDQILKMVRKGCTQAMHIEAGHKIMATGIELSECVLAGLGGENYYERHARETAEAINQINPHIIRFLTLAVPEDTALFKGQSQDAFVKSTDFMIAKEIKLFLEHLENITTFIESDNMLNLFQEVKGRMPDDREQMLEPLRTFMGWDPERRMLFQVGRRLQILSGLADMDDPQRVAQVRQVCAQNSITPNNVDSIITQMVQSFFN